MWYLVVFSPSGEAREYVLPLGRTTIGRHADNAIVLADTSASRLHAEVAYNLSSDSALLTDLGSTNGTYVNARRLASPHPFAGRRSSAGWPA